MSKNKNDWYQVLAKLLEKKVIIFLLFLFLLVSCLFISPLVNKPKSVIRSSQLKRVTVKNDKTTRTDYVDKDGKIRIAADLGYATMVVTQKDNGQIEQYFDDKGEPVRRNNGYYSVFREYDNKGNNIRNRYLSPDGYPAMTANGYAIEEKKYDDDNRLKIVKYYDTDGNPVASPYFGYGRINEYDEEGRNNKTTYIDASGNPMIISQGYASVLRVFYETDGPENGKAEKEFYYDKNGEPIALSLGQYGVHKEYNEKGQEAVLTYLDAEGQPIITNKGYTTVARTYQANNSVATELYYDLKGDPFSLSEGQYGIKRENGKTVYLNRDGKETLNLRIILYNDTWLVIPLTLAVVIISVFFHRKWNTIFLILYICIIAYLTLMFRDNTDEKRTEILWYYRRFFINSEARADILRNIWLFIPLGAILYQLCPEKSILFAPIVLSICIEGIQYIFGIGFCELDDIISNSIGGCVGYFLGKLTIDMKTRINKRKQIHSV